MIIALKVLRKIFFQNPRLLHLMVVQKFSLKTLDYCSENPLQLLQWKILDHCSRILHRTFLKNPQSLFYGTFAKYCQNMTRRSLQKIFLRSARLLLWRFFTKNHKKYTLEILVYCSAGPLKISFKHFQFLLWGTFRNPQLLLWRPSEKYFLNILDYCSEGPS